MLFTLFLALSGGERVAAGDEVYVIPSMKKNYAPVPKTGQTASHAAGDDGELEKGVAWPSPRFIDHGNGTVTDRLTGLIWTKKPACFFQRTLAQALGDAATLADGDCGLTDGSKAGDWRLPNIKELESLIDFGRFSPSLPLGHPFTNVYHHWSSTNNGLYAWTVNFEFGNQFITDRNSLASVWCVRDGP
jgi:hypothetical protein